MADGALGFRTPAHRTRWSWQRSRSPSRAPFSPYASARTSARAHARRFRRYARDRPPSSSCAETDSLSDSLRRSLKWLGVTSTWGPSSDSARRHTLRAARTKMALSDRDSRSRTQQPNGFIDHFRVVAYLGRGGCHPAEDVPRLRSEAMLFRARQVENVRFRDGYADLSLRSERRERSAARDLELAGPGRMQHLVGGRRARESIAQRKQARQSASHRGAERRQSGVTLPARARNAR